MQPKLAGPKPFPKLKILARLFQMRIGEEMGSNGQIEAKIWQFGHLEDNWHTTQHRRAKIRRKRSPKPFPPHKNVCKAHLDEEWWRHGFKRRNRRQDMAVWSLGGRLTHKTVQKGQNTTKTSRPKAVYNNKNSRKAIPDEEWWRCGFKWRNRSQDMADWLLGWKLTHKIAQNGQNAAKKIHPKAISNT